MGNTPFALPDDCKREGRSCDNGIFDTVKSTATQVTLKSCCHESPPDSYEQINTRHVYEASLNALNHDEYPKVGGFTNNSHPDFIASWVSHAVLPEPLGSEDARLSSLGAPPALEVPPLAPKVEDAYVGPEGYQKLLLQTRAKMIAPERDTPIKGARGKDKPGAGKQELVFPSFLKGRDVPLLGLVTPQSISRSDPGQELLTIARHSPGYRERFFNTEVVLQDMAMGGYIDVLREELILAKAEALQLKTRPRVIVGGDDKTTNAVIWLIFKALQADEKRASVGLTQFKDTGNGFIWTDDELRSSFPAIVQLPMGYQCNLADACGWSGSLNCFTSCFRGGSKSKSKKKAKTPFWPRCGCCGISRSTRVRIWQQLMESIIDPTTPCSNFDVWGIVPPFGADKLNFKLCELGARPGRTPKTKVKGKSGNITLKVADGPLAKSPASWLVLLNFSAGYGAYLRSRCKANRHSTPFKKSLESWRQFFGVVCEKTPQQMRVKTNGIKVECLGGKGGDCLDHGAHHKAQAYFPPRGGRKAWGINCWSKGNRYREVGFYNVNCRAFSGAQRAPLYRRLCFSRHRRPVLFDDGCVHMYRMRFKSYLKNPGTKMQTDKRKDMTLSFETSPGKGVFVQFDGESRFAFSPDGQRFDMMIRKVINLPVVIGPFFKDAIDETKKVEFELYGDTREDKEQSRLRMLQSLNGVLDAELHANEKDIQDANLPLYEPPHDTAKGTPSRVKQGREEKLV